MLASLYGPNCSEKAVASPRDVAQCCPGSHSHLGSERWVKGLYRFSVSLSFALSFQINKVWGKITRKTLKQTDGSKCNLFTIKTSSVLPYSLLRNDKNAVHANNSFKL